MNTPVKTLALLLAFFFAFSVASGQSGSLSGKVVEQLSGEQIPNATVSLFSDERVLTTKVDPGGNFSFSAPLPIDARELLAFAPGFQSISVALNPSQPMAVSYTFRLEVGSGSRFACGGKLVFPPPEAHPAYEPREGSKHVTGKLVDLDGKAVVDAAVLLLRYAVTSPSAAIITDGKPATGHIAPEALIETRISDGAGEFEFGSKYLEAELVPGWHHLKVVRRGYGDVYASFWIARRTLTNLGSVYVVPEIGPNGCS